MTLLIYIIKTIFISGGLLGYYLLCLRNRPIHSFNRIFLLSIPVISLIIPALRFNLPAFWNHAGPASPIHLLGVARGTLEEAVTVYASRKKGLTLTWQSLALFISVFISLVLMIRLINSIRYIRNLRNQNPSLPLPAATLYFVSEKGTPFSFFKSIFWGKEMELNNPEGRQILRHELFHVTQKHSLDILLIEICSIIMWFNPFLYIIRSELKIIHEYAADSHATINADEFSYAQLLLTHISGNAVSIVHPFFKNQLKRRIAMITKNNKNKKSLLGRILILPLLLIFIALFSFKPNSNTLKPGSILSVISPASIRVIIDPGHGGDQAGTIFNGISEKNINLDIAKKIQVLSKEYHVEVIMTRETDEDMAGNNLKASLNYRTELAANKNADLFISIHVNGTPEPGPQNNRSGFEIYVPAEDNKFHTGSVKLASSISELIKPDYSIAPELFVKEHSIHVLDNATVPAIMIECGYITNESDLNFILNPKNQEKIARDILEGIQKYVSSQVPAVKDESSDTTSYLKFGKMDLSEVVSFHMNSENKSTTLSLKDGKHIVLNWTKETVEEYGSPFFPNYISRDSTAPLRKVEVEAEYPGGFQQWAKYLSKTLKYPDEAIANEVQGTVMVEFVVNEDGSLTEIHAVSGPSRLRSESVRVIRESGKWTPAKDKGVIVASYHKQPIVYKLETK
jgi:TonB family protein